MKLAKILPWAAAALSLVGAVVMALSHGKARGFDMDAFGRLPVLDGGRVKPVDSVARNSLLMIRSQQSFRFDPDGEAGPLKARTIEADEWVLDLMFRPEVADKQPVFEINDPDVLGLIGLRQARDRAFVELKLEEK